jgi:hypothetical protein
MDMYFTKDGSPAAQGASEGGGVRGAPHRAAIPNHTIGPSHTIGPVRTIGTEQVPALPLFDADLGQIFIRMRGITGLGVWDMARAAGTDPTVIANLEAGALDALPDWAEVVRIVEAYAALAQVEGQPILGRMLQGYAQNAPQIAAPIPTYLNRAPERVTAGTAASVDVPAIDVDDVQEIVPYDVAQARRQATTVRPMTVTSPSGTSPLSRAAPKSAVRYATVATTNPSDGDDVEERDHAPRRRMWPIVAIFGAVLLVSTLLTARMAPGLMYLALMPLPETIQSPVLKGVDALVRVMAPTREGLVWIDVADPRARRRDKLQDWGR